MSRIQAWCRTLRDEPAKALPVPSHDLVYSVDEPIESEPTKSAPDRSSERDLDKQRNGATPITSDWCAIPADEPPTLLPSFFWHRGEQAPRLLIGERKKCERLPAVERGDDPRRPTAEPSAAGIEQNRAREIGSSYGSRPFSNGLVPTSPTAPRARAHRIACR
jgi:hypothetical protein